jgi:methionyl-tRNA formyltransferase
MRVSWRVVITTQVLPVVQGFHAAVTALGHEPVALLTTVDRTGRYDFANRLELSEVPPELDVLVPARRSSIAPLLRSVEPDLVVCMGFPWKVPPDALAVPRLGWVNGHPSLLPRHRGPIPIAWAIRNGDEEIGITFHRMDAELDTGAILAQRAYPLGEPEDPDTFYLAFGQVIGETLVAALERLASGDEGDVQEDGGDEYETFFTAEDAWLDLSRPAAEVHRLVWAWRYGMIIDGTKGALVELDRTTVRVLSASLTEVEGKPRVECADGPLWIVETEELSEAEATQSSAPAPSTP